MIKGLDVRKVDTSGRITLPARFRKELDIELFDHVELYLDEGEVVLKKIESMKGEANADACEAAVLKVDVGGKISFPVRFRRALGIELLDPVELHLVKGRIVLKRIESMKGEAKEDASEAAVVKSIAGGILCLPARFRRALDIQPLDYVKLYLDEGEVVLKKIDNAPADSSGVVKVDAIGKIYFLARFRRELGIQPLDHVEMYLNNDGIVLRKMNSEQEEPMA